MASSVGPSFPAGPPLLPEIAPTLREVLPGFFVASEQVVQSSLSFPSDGHAGCFQLEEGSYWFLHRNRVLLDTLARFTPGGPLLDIGGGNGFVTRALQGAGHQVMLLEPALEGARNALSRGVRPVIASSLEGAAFRTACLAAAGLFDVLEHLADDRAFLDEVRRVLRPQGRLYVTVPAWQWLWSHADRGAGHHRRYAPQRLRQVLESAGFTVEHVTCFFGFLTLPLFFGRALPDRLRPPARDRQQQASQEHHPGTHARRALGWAGALERALLRRGRVLPFGTSLLAVARRV